MRLLKWPQPRSNRFYAVMLLAAVVILFYQNCAPIGDLNGGNGTSTASSVDPGAPGGTQNPPPPGTPPPPPPPPGTPPGTPDPCIGNRPPSISTSAIANVTAYVGMDDAESGTRMPNSISIVGSPGAGETTQALNLRCQLRYYDRNGVATNMNPVTIDGCNTSQFVNNGGLYSARLRFQKDQNAQCFQGRIDVVLSARDACNADAPTTLSFQVNMVDACLPEVKVRASDAGYNENFGYKTAITDTTMAVLSSHDGETGPRAGAVYIYTKSGTAWTFQAKVRPSDGADNSALVNGEINAIALRGNRLLVGVPYRAGVSAVYVFERSGATWSQTARLLSPDGGSDAMFGYSVALSDTTLVIGAPRDSSVAAEAGAVYLYQMVGGVWNLQKKQTIALARRILGSSVAIEGNIVAAGAPVDSNSLTTAGMGSGQVYVWDISNIAAPAQDIIDRTTVPAMGLATLGDQFGFDVAINGGRILAGAPTFVNGGRGKTGAAFLLSPSAGAYALTKRLGGAGVDDLFGKSVAIVGNDIVIGAPQNSTRMGVAYYYDLANAAISGAAAATMINTATFKIMARDRINNNEFGNDVAISTQGEAVVGSHLDDLTSTESGTGANVVDGGSAYAVTLP